MLLIMSSILHINGIEQEDELTADFMAEAGGRLKVGDDEGELWLDWIGDLLLLMVVLSSWQVRVEGVL